MTRVYNPFKKYKYTYILYISYTVDPLQRHIKSSALILICFFFVYPNPRTLQVAVHGVTVRRTARAAGHTYLTTSKSSTRPCTREVITVPEPFTLYRPSWAAVARTCAPRSISSETPFGVYVRPISNLGPTANPAYVSHNIRD